MDTNTPPEPGLYWIKTTLMPKDLELGNFPTLRISILC